MADDPIRRPAAERLASWLSEKLRGHGGFILLTFASVFGALAAIPGCWWFALVAIVPAVLGIIMHLRLKPSYAELARREAAASERESGTADALQAALESVLRRIARHCGVDQTHQRISIYCHVEPEFVMLARHSASTVLGRHGRGVYPERQGVIGEAWDVGESYRSRWPDNPEDWIRLQIEQYGIPEHVARAFKMQTRSMAAMRISQGHKHVGVIVMESLQPQGVKKGHLASAGTSMLLESAGEILLTAQPHFPAVAERLRARHE